MKFSEIEKILRRPLSKSLKKYTAKWYTRPDQNAIAEAWQTEGYCLDGLDFEKQRVTFRREERGLSHVKLPSWLVIGKVPDKARAEIEDFLAYIKKKYGL